MRGPLLMLPWPPGAGFLTHRVQPMLHAPLEMIGDGSLATWTARAEGEPVHVDESASRHVDGAARERERYVRLVSERCPHGVYGALCDAV